jgi:hypothetical protein
MSVSRPPSQSLSVGALLLPVILPVGVASLVEPCCFPLAAWLPPALWRSAGGIRFPWRVCAGLSLLLPIPLGRGVLPAADSNPLARHTAPQRYTPALT